MCFYLLRIVLCNNAKPSVNTHGNLNISIDALCIHGHNGVVSFFHRKHKDIKMNTYILIAVITYFSNAATTVSQEFNSKESCNAALVQIRKEAEFTNNGAFVNGRIRVLQCLKK